MSNCPVCEKDSDQLNNHVRMSAGGGHGPQGTYPEGWDQEAAEFVDVEQGNTLDLDDPDPDDDPDDELEELTLGQDDQEAREYECGNCGEPIGYLGGDDREEGGKQCPECGERLFWSMMNA